MKRKLIIIVSLLMLMLMSATVSANERHGHRENSKYHNYNNDNNKGHHEHRYSNDGDWRHIRHNDYEAERHLPFRWHDNYYSIGERHRMERIHDREWEQRFPGVRAHRWHGDQGFWHHGHYVTDAVLFFNDDNRLVSIGYIADGVFIHFREDHGSYENRSSFFLSWWSN